MTSRPASHAGSWYSASKVALSAELDSWLAQVPDRAPGICTASSKAGPVKLPLAGARVIIAPHAGYAYSGPAAAWAYKSVDWSRCKRIFLLGPSHHHSLANCALTSHTTYSTPLGPLPIDSDITAALASTGHFSTMTPSVDAAEHSLEMHLPYIHKMLSLSLPPSSPPSDFPTLIPILIGNTSPSTERRFGTLLTPYLSDPSSIFILSSDFCHWGDRFRYTYYRPSTSTSPSSSVKATHLRRRDGTPKTPPLYESIATLDHETMDAVESGSHAAFWSQLNETGNTVCGRHPIGVFLCAAEALRSSQNAGADAAQSDEAGRKGEGEEVYGSTDETGWPRGHLRFLRYERSNDAESVEDFSVSYCSAVAVL